MTAQIGDSYLYKGENYQIVAMSVPINFDPRSFGFKPQCFETACWNGYWCKYKISEEGVFLDKLFIHCQNDEYPDLNGISFAKDENGSVSYMGYKVYNDLNMKIEYDGKILVGGEFIQDHYIHMGYQRAYAYKVLKEFVFHDGNLKEVIDHSDMAEMLRAKEEMKNKTTKKKNIAEFVEKSFSLDYKDKCWWME